MEKLLNLINEYGKTSNCWPFEDYRIEPATDYNSSYLVLQRDDNWEWDWKDWFLDIPRLISKDYWFIDWLVKNDKIEREKTNIEKSDDKRYDEWIVLASNYDNDTYVVEKYYSYTEQLLMILSIQDNQIEYLCSILK